MAELYQIATGSKKISNLTVIDGISGSAVIPVVMSNVVGGSYPITNGTTNQISYQDFRESVILNNQNTFTIQQSIITTAGKKITQLTGDGITILTGSALGSETDGFKVDSIGGGVKLYSYDSTEAIPANRFKTFIEVGTGYGNVTFTRNLIASGNLNVVNNLGIGGNLNINQNLIVGGTITAQSYNTEFISASIIYESGSTKFGDTTDDRHERTGSLLVSGSSAVVGNLSVSGIVQNALLGAVTTSLINQNTSQGLVNNLTQAVTSSLITIVGGLQSYTASLKSAAIVSSSEQILNYNIFATTGSNTFIGNQRITGSLSISNGQFSVTSGSGFLTSSLAFTHNTISPTQGYSLFTLRHINNDFNENFALKLFADDYIAKMQYEKDGLTYDILQTNLAGDLFLMRDTRLFGKGLTVDDSLLVKGIITGSLLSTNGVVSSSNQLVELNTFTGSLSTSATNINSFTASQLVVNDLTLAVTSSLITQNTSQGLVNNLTQAVTASLITQNTSQGLVNTLTSAVTQSLINQNTSQNSVNTLTAAVTSSLITIVGGLQTYTASLKSVSIVSSSNQLFELNLQTGSQNSVNNLTQAVTSSLLTTISGVQSYTASLKGQAIVSSSSQILNYNILATTGSNTFVGNQTITGSFLVSGSTTQIGNNTLLGNTILSGSIEVIGTQLFVGTNTLSGSSLISGSSIQFGNNTLIGNNTITGSNSLLGNNTIEGNNTIIGNTVLSGSINVSGSFTGSVDIAGNLNIASGSGFYRWGNKLFNYGQWGSLETQSGSANTANAMKLGTSFNGAEGVTVANNGSGLPTRITAENRGLYNIQFSAQLGVTATEACEFSVWFAYTGSNMMNSNTDFSIEKISGGGNGVAALNLLMDIQANDWVELYWSNTTGNGQLQYKGTQVSPNRPATPSIIVTVTQVA